MSALIEASASKVIPLADLAAENGLSRRAFKRRLLKLDARIRKTSPLGPFCLIQHGEPGSTSPYLVDTDVLFLHARGYLHHRLERSPAEEMRTLMREMREDQLATARDIATILAELAAIRLALQA